MTTMRNAYDAKRKLLVEDYEAKRRLLDDAVRKAAPHA